jgi:FkbM family methyltransferase
MKLILTLWWICATYAQNEKFSDLYKSRLGSLAKLASIGIVKNITTIVDVGANYGDWTRMAMEIFPGAEVFMIEGNPNLEPKLKLVGAPFAISLVGETKKEVPFHVHKRFPTGGSILKEKDYEYFRQEAVLTQNIPMDTLDNILKDRFNRPIDFLKMDVQGYEYFALLGATDTLKKTRVLTLETSIQQYNPGSPPFTDINVFLEENGFRLYDIIDLRYSHIGYKNGNKNKKLPATLIQADMIWIRKDSDFSTELRYPEPPIPRRKLCPN